ncbi:MAG: two-component regulator propeller domain-containing protein [Bacteroidota bacterium]|nr:two-component regulator propeller domain-containing protein [Bacteroidota bacterium]MDP3146945.1 two-component regulator propeller domain-containing protein [Bacteroidota bacterium]
MFGISKTQQPTDYLKKRFCFFCILLFFNIGGVFSQQYNFLNYGVEDGLPQSTVYEIFQDKDGYLWLGTDGGGLSRYDGYRFKTFNKSDGLNANVIRKIVQDKQNNIWVATNAGLYIIKNGKIELFSQVSDNRSIFFFSVFIDSKQNIWAASTGHGIFKICPTANNAFSVKNYLMADGLSNDYIFDVCEDDSGKIWMAAFGEGLDVLDPKTERINNFKQQNNLYNEVICIKKAKNNHLLLGTKSAGAFEINASEGGSISYSLIPGTEGNQVWSIEFDEKNNYLIATDKEGVVSSNRDFKLNTKNGLLTNKIFKVFVDREKNIWIGTSDAGMSKYLGNRFTHITANELPDLLQVSAVVKDNKETFWLGSSTSGLYHLSYVNGQTKLIERKTSTNGLSDNDVTGLSNGLDNTLWISTRNGVSNYNGKTFKNYSESSGLISSNANCVLADSKSRIWIGTSAGLSLINEQQKISNISESNGLLNNEVQCFLEDKNKNIWIGTLGGLIKYDGEKMFSFFEEDGLEAKKIHCLTEDKSGNIYIGTFGGGIYKLDVKSKSKKNIYQLCPDEQLVSNNIYSLTFQNDSVLLVGTNQGLNKILFDKNLKIKTIIHIGTSAGFKNLENSSSATLNNNNTEIWFGTQKGVTIYHPLNDKKNLVKPDIRITEVLVNGTNYSQINDFAFAHNQNTIKVNFVSISLTNPSANVFYAKLIGQDTSWNKLLIDKQNLNEFVSVEYKKLQPGNYQLLLKSKNNDGIESETLSFSFSIALPFYKTKWFIFGAIIFSFILVYLFFKYRERKLIKEKEKLEEIVTERTAEVVASKKEIEEQKDLLQIQKHEITDSINYSKRIQNAILPEKNVLFKNFPKSFILYQPKDIVSGDFYFFTEGENGTFYLAVADCTGHGVPGAFMSMIGSKELSEAVKKNREPSDILAALNIGVRETLKQNNLEIGIKDGMDIGLVAITTKPNTREFKVSYAGANRPLWITRKNEKDIVEIKATKTAIGGYTLDSQIFEQHELAFNEGDTLYLFSDGYADQFGGDHGKKMMTKRFKELIIDNSNLDISQQEKSFGEYFNTWKGPSIEQVDDVLIIGIKF